MTDFEVDVFGPQTEEEREIFAAEKFRVDVQHKLQTVMNRRGVNQKELARRLNVSQARVSQVFSSKCNVTVKFIARLFHALDDEVWLDTRELQAARRQANGGVMHEILDCESGVWHQLKARAANDSALEVGEPQAETA